MIKSLWHRIRAFITRLLQDEPRGSGWNCYGEHDDG